MSGRASCQEQGLKLITRVSPYLLSSETTAMGMGLEKLAGKGDTVELESSLAL